MQALAQGVVGLPANDHADLHFALGKALEDQGDYDAAFGI